MITLFGCAYFFNFVSFLLYPADVKRLKCAMLGAFTVKHLYEFFTYCSKQFVVTYNKMIYNNLLTDLSKAVFLL